MREREKKGKNEISWKIINVSIKHTKKEVLRVHFLCLLGIAFLETNLSLIFSRSTYNLWLISRKGREIILCIVVEYFFNKESKWFVGFCAWLWTRTFRLSDESFWWTQAHNEGMTYASMRRSQCITHLFIIQTCCQCENASLWV